MTSRFEDNMTVQDAVRQCPHGEVVLRRFGIAQDDTRTLPEAASKEHMPVELLIAALNKAALAAELSRKIDGDQLQATLLGVIIDYIMERYHCSLRSELPRLDELLNRVIEARGHGEGSKLVVLRTIFRTVKTQIEEHLAIEEQILFPRLRRSGLYARKQGSTGGACKESSPVTAISEMQHEHEVVEWGFKEMREITEGYAPAGDSSEMLVALYEGLLRLEVELLEHAHLENDLLWPARAVEKTSSDSAVYIGESTPNADEEEPICPRSNSPCDEGSPVACSKFWDCVREAMEQRWAKVDDANKDG
jgi:regulator of cell morphogenesis and NO signaling